MKWKEGGFLIIVKVTWKHIEVYLQQKLEVYNKAAQNSGALMKWVFGYSHICGSTGVGLM